LIKRRKTDTGPDLGSPNGTVFKTDGFRSVKKRLNLFLKVPRVKINEPAVSRIISAVLAAQTRLGPAEVFGFIPETGSDGKVFIVSGFPELIPRAHKASPSTVQIGEFILLESTHNKHKPAII